MSSELLSDTLQYSLFAIQNLSHTKYWTPIVAAVVICTAIIGWKRWTALPLLVWAPACSAVTGQWFWFEVMNMGSVPLEEHIQEKTISLLVGLVVGIVIALYLCTSCGEQRVWSEEHRTYAWKESLPSSGMAFLGFASMPISTLVAQIATTVALGIVVSIMHDPTNWVMSAILLTIFFGGIAATPVIIIFL